MSETPPLMTPVPTTGNNDLPPEPPHRPRRLWKILLRLGIGFGSLVTVGGVVFYVWGDRLVTNLLLPRVATILDETIERPVEMGDVESLSLWGVKLGKTVIPPTETDASSVTVDGIEISIGLRSLLSQRIIKSNVVLIRPDVSLIQGEDGEWLELTLPEPSEEEPPVELEIQSIKVQDAIISAVPYLETGSDVVLPQRPIQVAETDALVEFFGESAQEASFELEGKVIASEANEAGRFAVDGAANLETQTVKANARVNNLPSVGVNLLLPDSLGLLAGELNGNLTAEVDFEDGVLDRSSVDLRGTAQFQNGEVLVAALPDPIQNIRGEFAFKGQQVSLEDASLQLSGITLLANGDVDLETGYNLTAQIPSVSIAEIQSIADVELPVAVDGAFNLVTQVRGELDSPTLDGRLASLGPLLIDKVALETVQADFEVILPEFQPTRFDLNELRAQPTTGGEILANGLVDLTNLENPAFQLASQASLSADALAQTYGINLPAEIVLGVLNADFDAAGDLDSQAASANWQLEEGTFPGSGEVTLADTHVVLNNTRLQAEQGTITADAVLELDSGDWQATANTDQVAVSQFTDNAQGLLSADVEAFGNLNALDLDQIEARGTPFFANAQASLTKNGVPLLEPGDWTTAFEWAGDAITVNNFSAPGLQADGTIGVDFTRDILIGNLAFNVGLQSYDLQRLNGFVPSSLGEYAQLDGLTSFDGKISGTLDNPTLSGSAQLTNLAVNELLFEPLAGPVDFSLAEGGRVTLQGQEDQLQLVVQSSPQRELPYWPVSFEVRNQDFVANGVTEGDMLRAEVVQLPLERFAIQPAAQYGFSPVAGLLEASVNVDLANLSEPTATGTLAVTQPNLSPIEAEQFKADFAYADGTATLQQGELLFEDGRYLLTGRANLIGDIEYQGELTIAEGRVENLIPILEKIDFSAFGLGNAQEATGSATDLATNQVGLPENAPLSTRLERFMAFLEAHPEANAIAQDQETSENEALRPLEQIEGAFTGTITVSGSSLAFADAMADFDIQGNSWDWGDNTPPNQFALRGEVARSSVNIDTAFVQTGKTEIDLTASGDLDQLNGQLVVNDLPVAVAQLFYPLPADITGDLDVSTTFGGNLSNPVVQGEALVAETQINGYPLNGITADFDYRNALLTLDSEVVVDADVQPITVEGTIPYALPFATLSPPTEQLDVVVNVPARNLEIINALTDRPVFWQSGQGEVVVEVGGTLSQPTVVGQASFRDGALNSSLFKDDFTRINGEVVFNLQQIDVQQLQASFGDGQVAVNGRLPLLPSGESILPQLLASSSFDIYQDIAQDIDRDILQVQQPAA
ncbi:MAG: hypothetical protein AAGL17_00495, partial [Cyanobacteria bacterium J06576_12]